MIVATIGSANAQTRRPSNSSSSKLPSEAQIRVRLNTWTIGLAGGPIEGALIRLATEMTSEVSGGTAQVLPVVTRGPAENVDDLLDPKGLDAAIITRDSAEQDKAQAPQIMAFATCVATQACTAADGIAGLEACFQAARQSDVVCSNPDNSPEARLDCFQKARAAQLECLDHVPLGITESAVSADASDTISPQNATSQIETVSAPKPDQGAGPVVATAPPVASPVAVAPSASTAIIPPTVPGPPAAILATPSSSNWTISETTSPIDYSPLVIATMRSSSDGKDAPEVLSVMCRRLRPEITLRTEGAWRAAKNHKVQVLFQINDKSAGSAWTLSADGKTASSPDHVAELLRSLPDDTSIKVNVSDGADHGAVFEVTGLDIVRRKISQACRLTPLPPTRLSAEKR